jgi:hypothetical protein
MALDGTLGVSFTINDRRTVGISTSANLFAKPAPSIAYTDGVGANQANSLYNATRSLVSGADSVDLTGTLKDLYGSNFNLVRVKGLYIFVHANATGNMTFGNDTNAWATFLGATSTMVLHPGDIFLIATPGSGGWGVTASTGDILKVAGTGTDSYDIAVIGGLT